MGSVRETSYRAFNSVHYKKLVIVVKQGDYRRPGIARRQATVGSFRGGSVMVAGTRGILSRGTRLLRVALGCSRSAQGALWECSALLMVACGVLPD